MLQTVVEVIHNSGPSYIRPLNHLIWQYYEPVLDFTKLYKYFNNATENAMNEISVYWALWLYPMYTVKDVIILSDTH